MPVRKDPSRVAIAPSILSADFGRLAEEVGAVERAGADLVHVDVMDGHFVPNITIGPLVVAAVRQATSLPLDVHLMIEEPERYVEAFAAAGADILTVHVETCPHLHRVLQQIREAGAKPAVVLNPHTPLEMIDHVLEDVEMVLLMSVNPGFGGQSFIPAVLPKIEALAGRISRRGLDVDIEVDGGIKLANSGSIASAGATILVAGSAVFQAEDYERVIDGMKKEAAAFAGGSPGNRE
ncbi:MAG: ribulose-phosphate 3-epimerase [Myxococcota bacterium]